MFTKRSVRRWGLLGVSLLMCVSLLTMLVARNGNEVGGDTPSSGGALQPSRAHPDSNAVERQRLASDGGMASYGEGYPAYSAEEFTQFVLLEDWKYVTIQNHESDPEHVVIEYEYSASYEVHAFAARYSNEFYLGGLASNGDVVIERWRLIPHEGSWRGGRDPSGTGLGTPVPHGEPSTAIVGGTYALPEVRRHNPRMEKTELYRGDAFSLIRGMNVDPEGRFLLLLTDQDELLQMELAGDFPWTVIHDASTIPELALAHGPVRFQHILGFRIWSLDCPQDPPTLSYPVILLLDHQNDGLFDDFLVDGWLTLLNNGMMGAADVVDDFIVY